MTTIRQAWSRFLDIVVGPEYDPNAQEIHIYVRDRTRHDDYVDAYMQLLRELGREPTPLEIYERVL